MNNNTEKTKTKTTKALKLVTLAVGIIINPFQTKVYKVKVPVNVKIGKKDVLHGKIYEERSEKGILILLIHAVVVLFLVFSVLFR